MSVYVDDMEAPFGRMIMCHMVADTHTELVEMADKIGVGRHWIQKAGHVGEHFDIAKSKRKLAVEHGAIEITWADCGRREYENRHKSFEEWHLQYFGIPAPTQTSQPIRAGSVAAVNETGPETSDA